MKTLRNRHTRNRTSRRRMKGGGYEEDIALIKKFLVPIPADLIAANQGIRQLPELSLFLDKIVPRDEDLKQLRRILRDYPVPKTLLPTLQTIEDAKIGRQLVNPGANPFILSLAQRFQSELAEILPIIIANPPARKANIDWFPSLQKLHRVSKDYATSRAPTQGARINAKFDRVDTASKKDAKESRKDEAEQKLLDSIREFSGGTLDIWFNKLRNLVNVSSIFREQAIADIWAIVPADMPPPLTAELHTIFDRHTAFLAEKSFDAPVAEPLQAQEKPGRPERKVPLGPKPDEPLVNAASVPLPASVPGTPNTGERMAEPKELPSISLSSGPAPLLAAPPSQILSSAPPRRGERAGKPVSALAEPAANPASLLTGQSSPVAPIVSPTPLQQVNPSVYRPAELPSSQQPLSNAAPEPSLTSFFSALLPRKEVPPSTPQSQLSALDPGVTSQPRVPLSEVNPLRRGTTSLQPQPTPQESADRSISSQAAPALVEPGSRSQTPGKKLPASGPPTAVKVVRQPVQKRLFKQGDRVSINLKGRRNIEKFPKAVRAEIQKTTCNDPFYATVEADQKANSPYVRIICDKGGQYNEEDENLSYIPPESARLTRTPGPAPTQPTPVVPLEENTASVRRGELPATRSSSLLGTPATISDCDQKLIGMTHRATVCETELARLRAELAQMMETNTAETARLRANINEEKANLARLQASKAEVEQNLRSASQTERNLREYIGRYGRELGAFRTKTEALEKEKAELDAKIQVLRRDLEKSKAENKESAEELARLSSEREADIARLTENYASIMSQLAQTIREQDELQGKYAETNAKLAAAEASVADLNTRFATTDALITAADRSIRSDLEEIKRQLTDGVQGLSSGLSKVTGLVESARSEIEQSRQEFTGKFSSLQRDLTTTNLVGRGEILEAIRELRGSNQEIMAALQRDLADASAEKLRLQTQIGEEQTANARLQGELQAKNQEIERKREENAQALAEAREAAATTAQQLQEANRAAARAKDEATLAEVARLRESYATQLDELSTRLSAAVARAQVAETGNQERRALAEELARVRTQIAAIPPPLVVPPPEVVVAPKILRRDPAGEVSTGTPIQIFWDQNGTAGPWILRIDYDGTNSDFQEVTMPGPIAYTIKRPGALSGRIYNIKQV